MMKLKPFKAFRFDAVAVGDVGSCISPPYDVISPAQQQALYEKSEYNIVRIIKGKTSPSDNADNNQYTRAANYLNDWIKKGALKQDPAETIYAYVQDFQLAGVKYSRPSFIALARLEEFAPKGSIYPHEQTLNAPKTDRLSLKRATASDFGMPFMLYEDKQKIADKIIEKASAQKPLIDFLDEQDVRHRIFAVTDKKDIDAITKMMLDKSSIIADGHHRYETALIYSKESSNPAAAYRMLAFTNTENEGVVVLATHRIVSNLENFDAVKLIASLKENFEITKYKFDARSGDKAAARQKMLAQMKTEYDNDKTAFGIYAGGAFRVAVLKNKQAMDSVAPNMSVHWRSLDVSVLHKLILEKLLGIGEKQLADGSRLEYIKDTDTAIDESIAKVDSGQKQAAFFTNPVKMQQIKLVTAAGEKMPQKSTYFYPKIFSGLTINKL
ncbi:MAG: DUF1015 domain-containing protein [Phycisphaerae bacterium]|nr:DUF1015 domain-containing protein [Phycisphaerae bacterium]MDD5380022.1 DUF1015 domain-containing protein [Phycisphaerae bacterium]